MSSPPYSDAQLEFLRAHGQAVLATTRRDGSPQVSTVAYAVDGHQVLISAKRYTAKHKNAARQPKVALVVNDGHQQLVVYGTAETIEDDPVRADLTAKVWEAMTGDAVDDPSSLVPMLDEQQRTIIRVTADKALFNP